MGIFDLLGGAVSDLFGGIGALSEAKAYSQAAKIAQQNVLYSKESTAIQLAQTQRNAFQVIGAQQAEVGGAGFAAGGSAQDLLRSSTEQANLAKGLVTTQGAITAGGFAQQAAAYQGQAAAAQAKAAGGFFGSLLGIAGAAISIFSDRTLKESIELVKVVEPGLNLYRFKFIGYEDRYVGVMADEVEAIRPDAVTVLDNGLKMVDYAKLGLTFERVD